MAHTKAKGTTKNVRDSQPKYLGVKLYAGQIAIPGNIIVRQRGSKFTAGHGVRKGKDDTIYAIKQGAIKFNKLRKKNFDGNTRIIKVVSIV
jgi:large subunit ribosomal protein L27